MGHLSFVKPLTLKSRILPPTLCAMWSSDSPLELPLFNILTVRYQTIQTFYTILNNIEIYGEPVPRTKEIPHYAVKFDADEENRIVFESLFCLSSTL